MSEHEKIYCRCAHERPLPPGSGIVLAILLGAAGLALAILVWIVSGSWIWTLLTWLLASPAGAIAVALRLDAEVRKAGTDCGGSRCLVSDFDSSNGRALNV